MNLHNISEKWTIINNQKQISTLDNPPMLISDDFLSANTVQMNESPSQEQQNEGAMQIVNYINVEIITKFV